MGQGTYTAVLTIFDDRNGEIVGEKKDIEIEQDGLDGLSIEEIEEFIGVSINKYEEDVWQRN